MTQRRDFIKKSVLGTASITIGAMGFSAKSYASIMGANNRFRIAVCGVNGRGKSHISGFSKQENVEIVYLVDPDSVILDSRVNQLREQEEGISNRVKGVADVRHVLDDKKIDLQMLGARSVQKTKKRSTSKKPHNATHKRKKAKGDSSKNKGNRKRTQSAASKTGTAKKTGSKNEGQKKGKKKTNKKSRTKISRRPRR